MSVDFERELGKFHNDPDKSKAALARLAAQASKTWRELYGPLSTHPSVPAKTSKEKLVVPTAESAVDLEVEWYKQAQRMADLFAKELKQSKDEYVEKLPRFSPQPETFKGRFDTPVVAETRIALPRMLDIVGINPSFGFDTTLLKDWQEDMFRTPTSPYTTWLDDGRRNMKKAVETVRKNLVADERGGSVYDGVALYLKNPDILKHHFLDFPGS